MHAVRVSSHEPVVPHRMHTTELPRRSDRRMRACAPKPFSGRRDVRRKPRAFFCAVAGAHAWFEAGAVIFCETRVSRAPTPSVMVSILRCLHGHYRRSFFSKLGSVVLVAW